MKLINNLNVEYNHGDIKAENIVVSNNNKVRLIDFETDIRNRITTNFDYKMLKVVINPLKINLNIPVATEKKAYIEYLTNQQNRFNNGNNKLVPYDNISEDAKIAELTRLAALINKNNSRTPEGTPNGTPNASPLRTPNSSPLGTPNDSPKKKSSNRNVLTPKRMRSLTQSIPLSNSSSNKEKKKYIKKLNTKNSS
jgi:hypothetical protein